MAFIPSLTLPIYHNFYSEPKRHKENLVISVSLKNNKYGFAMSENNTHKESAANSHDIAVTPLTIFRYTASICILILFVVIVGALIFTGNTRVAKDANPAVALIVCVSA